MRDVQLLQLVYGTPWVITEDAYRVVCQVVDRHARGDRLDPDDVAAAIGPRRKPVQSAGGGVAVVPLRGVIVPHAGSLEEVSGATSVEGFMANLRAAVNDPSVSTVIVNVDSPGGALSLIPEAAAEMRTLRRQKPIVAVANTWAASGAYYLASQASELVVSPSGKVGSIGVLIGHEDISGLLDQAGVKMSLIHAGQFKTEGNAFQPLTQEARDWMQAHVDGYYRMFVSDVAAGRGTGVTNVRDNYGQGRMLMAADALKVGMVDRVATLDQEIQRALAAGQASKRTRAEAEDLEAEELEVEQEIRSIDDRMAILQTAATRSTAEMPLMISVQLSGSDQPQEAAGPIRPHSTPVVDEPWNAAENVNRINTPVTGSVAQAMWAWYDDQADDPDGDGWPDAKNAYKLPHHMVNQQGKPGPANVRAVRNALSRLPQSSIPEPDRAGVERHLRRHLDDFNNQ